MNYSEAMNYINSFSKRGGSVSDLSRFVNLMKKLGNPQDELKFIHVAGTNGKGSCVRYLSSVLTLCGYKTGEFTSPFIVDYTDRIRIDGENIPHKRICEIIPKIVEATAGNTDYSQFEITNALAFLYYKQEKCDIVCLETGIGGLLDCTNIIKSPIASVIMSVSFDHTAVLGNTITEIAKQKAGIIKDNCPVILSADNDEECIDVIKKTARIKNSELIIPDINDVEVINSDAFGNEFIYKKNHYELSMGGKHQIYNAISAIETLKITERSGFSISKAKIAEGLKNATVPSRTEIFRKSPLILVDGAHNPSGMEALSEIIKKLPKKPVAVLGMLKTKDMSHALEKISPYIDSVICLDGFASNCVEAKVVKACLEGYGVKAECYSDYEKAIKKVIFNNEKGAVFCGSLYLTSVIRKKLIEILKEQV